MSVGLATVTIRVIQRREGMRIGHRLVNERGLQ